MKWLLHYKFTAKYAGDNTVTINHNMGEENVKNK